MNARGYEWAMRVATTEYDSCTLCGRDLFDTLCDCTEDERGTCEDCGEWARECTCERGVR